MSQIEIPNIRQGTDVHLWLRMVNSGVSVDWTIFDEIRVYIYSESQRQTAGKCTVEVVEDDATLLACEYPALENQFLGVQKVVLYTKLADQQNAYDKVAFCFVATTDETESTTTVEDEIVEVDLTVDDIDTSMLAGAIKAANEAAHSADAAAAAAREQGDAAGEAATLAAEKATLAEEKAGEAGEAATLATEKATLAEEKAGEAGEAATLATEKATLAEEKAGEAQENGTYAKGQGDYAKEQGDYAKAQADGAKGTYNTLNDRLNAYDEKIPSSASSSNKLATASDVNAKYTKPSGGIPKTDLAQAVQTSLGKADSALPASDVVDNLTTEDATKALSAKQGKVLDNEVSRLGQKVNEFITQNETQVEYREKQSVNYVINANQQWIPSEYRSVILPVNSGEVYRIISGTNPGTLALLKTDNHTSSTTPDFCEEYPQRIEPADIPENIKIPLDCHYIVLRMETNGGDTTIVLYRVDASVNAKIFLSENNLGGIYPFYINATTKKWVNNFNSAAYCYRIYAGQKVSIRANMKEDASFAFIKTLNTASGNDVIFANGYDSVIMQETYSEKTYQINEDCFLYVFRRGSNIDANRFPLSITIENTESSFLEKVNRSFNVGSGIYYGEKPNFSSKSFGQKLLATLPAYSGRTGLHQGMAVYEDYLVLFTYDDNASPATCTAVLYDIPSATKLAEINLPYSPYRRPHGNALSFGVGFNSENSIVPSLYVSQWDEDGERGCLVYDITLSGGVYSATLIQAIIPNIDGSIFGNGYSDWVVDAENGYIYSVAYGIAVDGYNVQNDQTNPTKICKFVLPSLSSSEVILTGANIVENYAIRSLPYRQGLCISGGLLMIQRGNANVGHADWLDVHFVNLAKRAITTVMPLTQFGGETEGIAVYKGKLIMGWRGNARIYEFDF